MDLKEIEARAEEALWTIEALKQQLEDLSTEVIMAKECLETLLDAIREARAEAKEVEL